MERIDRASRRPAPSNAHIFLGVAQDRRRDRKDLRLGQTAQITGSRLRTQSALTDRQGAPDPASDRLHKAHAGPSILR